MGEMSMAPASLSQKTLKVPFSVCFYKTVVQVGLKLDYKSEDDLEAPKYRDYWHLAQHKLLKDPK